MAFFNIPLVLIKKRDIIWYGGNRTLLNFYKKYSNKEERYETAKE